MALALAAKTVAAPVRAPLPVVSASENVDSALRWFRSYARRHSLSHTQGYFDIENALVLAQEQLDSQLRRS